ncbi:hypothetical protein O0I10_007997 [Lichtheimia ornata]|uniref:BHLH domain-containing protein n=1 Tax=Lichtheimia ornata TaxID=688661 RepID=A0AAD7V042_9FUNG|nr:uncharacterized protein O0I10_007997 [Lichtheimia ornata]KAJ8656203.1 hypothetical protein O0I10_007997 [Lichtheimia ornata]
MSTGRSVRNAANNFLSTFSSAASHYGTIFSSADMARSLEESGLNELAHLDKRSAHNALERQRRENLNTKFQQLAHALPSLQSVRRPSKTVIVAKSLEFVSNSISRESLFQKRIENLRRENERLRDQAQQRAKMKQLGVTPSSSKSSSCSSSIAEQPMYLSPEQLMLHHPSTSPSPSSNTVAMDTVVSTTTSSSPATTTTTTNACTIEMTSSSSTTMPMGHACADTTTTQGPLATPVSPMMARKMSTAESVASTTATHNKQTTTQQQQQHQHQPSMEKEIQQQQQQPTTQSSDNKMMDVVVSSALDAQQHHHQQQGLSATAEPPQQPAAQPNVYDMAFTTMPQHLTSTPQSTVSLMDQHLDLPASMVDVNGYYLPPRTMVVAPPPPSGMQQQHMIPPFAATTTGSPNTMMPFPMMDMSFPGGAIPHPSSATNGTITTTTTPPQVSYMPDAAATFQFHAAAALAYPPPAYNAQPEQPTANIHNYNQLHW